MVISINMTSALIQHAGEALILLGDQIALQSVPEPMNQGPPSIHK
jgi:hypothetical protein